MDCNWCAVCSNHFHSDHQASLYCSEECRKADALACCAFHDCDHPDGSAHHDHLTFCHHHRPAIRIPSLPLLNINPNPSAEQQQHGQQQQDEWTRFLQQQYNTQYHAHSTHTSMLPSLGHSVSGPFTNQPQQRFMPFSAQQQPQSFLLSEALPTLSCVQQQQHAKQLRQQKPAFRAHHQRQASSLDLKPQCPMTSDHGDPAGLALSLSSLSLSRHRSSDPQNGHCDSSGDCEQPCVVRKNKTLPPPTLSHTLPPTISNPASLSPTSSGPPSTPVSPSSPASSGEEDTGGENMSHAWPTQDKFFFPDHCCRTSACNSSSSRSGTPANVNAKAKTAKSRSRQGQQGSQGNGKKNFVSELPPPPAKHAHGERDSANGGCIALSASIWGQGWHQVEPLPASFVKTIQKSNLVWSGCEKEHHSSARHHQRHRRDSGYGQGQGQGQGGCGHRAVSGNKSKMMRQWGQSKNASDASSWSTVCTSRLPRSLQFID
ncbi:hypothetical protein EC968_009308 [Mortierella alpina]|nr:hypothetical protein EC968_009308 [Mortierella alpina]